MRHITDAQQANVAVKTSKNTKIKSFFKKLRRKYGENADANDNEETTNLPQTEGTSSKSNPFFKPLKPMTKIKKVFQIFSRNRKPK